MSLTTFLLGSKSFVNEEALDTELDALFHSQAVEESTSNIRPAEEKERKKRKSDVHPGEHDKKRSKISLPSSSHGTQRKPPEKHVRMTSRQAVSGDSQAKSSSKGDSSSDSGLETSDEEDGDSSSILIHETQEKDKSSKSACKKAKYVPLDETKEKRDARTIFVGNLLPEVAVKRPLQKQLHQHILALVPTARIESTRFRSVAFQNPTSKLPEASDEMTKNKQLRQHERDRASSWRDAHSTDASKTDEKKFLTPSQKKKVAFIHKNIHPDADSVHAYVVFAHPSSQSRPVNLPPLPVIMDPYEAACLAIQKCNGTIFLDRMLRVDAVAKSSPTKSLSDGASLSSVIADPKLTVFVGNLDFASKEEDLRVFFEGVVSAERGPPDTEGLQNEDKPTCWVTRVRMIRDKDTQLGKGFAYVQFADRTCVDEILAFDPGKLKFAKRKLRVQRCKSIPGTPVVNGTPAPSNPVVKSSRFSVPSVPRGDPSLGDKLAKLTKDERKRVKTADVDRVARRMAKKKARLALAKEGVALQNKQRERVRKTNISKKQGSAPPKKTSKGRVRSEKSIARMNTKK